MYQILPSSPDRQAQRRHFFWLGISFALMMICVIFCGLVRSDVFRGRTETLWTCPDLTEICSLNFHNQSCCDSCQIAPQKNCTSPVLVTEDTSWAKMVFISPLIFIGFNFAYLIFIDHGLYPAKPGVYCSIVLASSLVFIGVLCLILRVF